MAWKVGEKWCDAGLIFTLSQNKFLEPGDRVMPGSDFGRGGL